MAPQTTLNRGSGKRTIVCGGLVGDRNDLGGLELVGAW